MSVFTEHRAAPFRRAAGGVLLLGLLLARSVAGQSAEELQLLAWVDEHRGEAVDLLEQITNINSYTLNPDGVREVARVLAPHFDALGFETRWIDGSAFERSGHLFAERRGTSPRMLLIGHLDTVFPADDPFDTFRLVDDTTVAGPGVGDMKGGLVQILFALRVLRAIGREPEVTPVIFVNSDEEVGSPDSKAWVRRLARSANRALVLEPTFIMADEPVSMLDVIVRPCIVNVMR